MLNMRQAIIWTNDGLDWLCTYVPLGLNELTHGDYDYVHVEEMMPLCVK